VAINSDAVVRSVPVIEMRNITKRFYGVLALNNVNLTVGRAECLAVLGENGAGKSTLMKILGGVYQKDEGTILIDGEAVHIRNPHVPRNLGIGFIHQEFNLVEDMSITANIYLGREQLKHRNLIVDKHAMIAGAEAALARLGVNLEPGRKIAQLTTAEKQLVEVARALSLDARVLVMDEPTASLSRKEIDSLFGIVETLKRQGVSTIYISHRLEEISEIADRVAVLRNGTNAGETTSRAPVSQLIEMMLGRKVDQQTARIASTPGDCVLKVQGLSTSRVLRNVNLKLNRGEILGVFGIAGAGQSELAMALFGLTHTTNGTIEIDGQVVDNSSPSKAIANGLGLLTDDRKATGLILDLSVLQNITLSALSTLSRLGVVISKRERGLGGSFLKRLNIRTRGLDNQVKFLSGGNQQKVVLARALSTKPRIVILNEPTRGVDVGSKREIYDLMNQLTEAGTAFLMISSELSEVSTMSDRVIVMYRGAVAAEFAREDATQGNLLTYAMGRDQIVDGS
jgi:ribose transport system ATP-binding protein